MLNEVREYECCLAENTFIIPLQQSSLDGRDGFRRLLRILAKGFLQNCEEQGLTRGESITYCGAFLQTWVTGETPKDLVIPAHSERILDDLQKAKQHSLMYHAQNLQEASIKDPAQLPKRMKALSNSVKMFANPPYQNAWDVTHNDFNRIYYDQIIADAFNRKPLRNQCLVMKREGLFSIACAENLRRIVLALVCMYLQDQDESGRLVKAAYLPITQAEVGNWLHVRVKKKDRTSNTASVALAIERARWGKPSEPLFDKERNVNTTKLRVNPGWLKEYEVRLMDAKDAENLPENYLKLDDGFFCGK